MSQPDADGILEDATELMTVVEVARWLRVDRRTVYRWVHEAHLPHMRVGRGIRFKRPDIEVWIRRRAEGQRDVTAYKCVLESSNNAR